MDEYTYSSIIIDPTEEGIESLIGKEVYFNDNPSFCSMKANEKSTDSLGVLVKIIKDSANPFRIKQNDSIHSSPCIIEKKKGEPEYSPFKDAKEFIRAYKNAPGCLDEEDSYLSEHGIWLKDKRAKVVVYCMVTKVWDNGLVICAERMRTDGIIELDNIISWSELYEGFTFLDGSPCGIEVRDSNG